MKVGGIIIDWNSEADVTLMLNILMEHSNCVFEWIINDDNDETYIPKVDFDYTIYDCKKNNNLSSLQTWRDLMKREEPIFFTNTTYLFNQFNNSNFLGREIENGAQAFAQIFYFFFRDKMWEEKKVKFIFLVKQENIDKMWEFVNAGFTIELIPRYLKKDKIKEEQKIKMHN